MLFGSNRDFDLLVGINRELLKDIIEQEIGYYTLSLNDTQANIYGEALEKIYLDPVKLNCLITRGDYYEVDTVRENQLFLGRDKSYNIESYGSNFGSSVSIIVDCHLTRTDRVGVTKAR